jgi:hypothetical protein
LNKGLLVAIVAIVVAAVIVGYSIIFPLQKTIFPVQTPSEQGKETPGQNYGIVTIKVVDQSNKELKANVSIAGKEGTSSFTLTLPYGVYKAIAKYKDFTKEQTIEVNQANQDVQIVITIPRGVVIINPIKIEGIEIRPDDYSFLMHCYNVKFTVVNEKGEKIIELPRWRYSKEVEYGEYCYIMSWEEGESTEKITITKNGTFKIEHPFQELVVVWKWNREPSNKTVEVVVNVLTPPSVEIKEISAQGLFDKLVQVDEEEKRGICNSGPAVQLYWLAGKRIIVTDMRIDSEGRFGGEGKKYYVRMWGSSGGRGGCEIYAESTYSPEKRVRSEQVISFEGKVLSVRYPVALGIEMTYDRLIAKK